MKSPRLGSHMSTAGGVANAIERGLQSGCDTIQIFTKNNQQWQGPPISREAAADFRRAQTASGIAPVFSHNCYLINLASTNPRILKKSIAAMIDEIKRAELLELPFVVTHPGAHVGAGEESGLKRIAASLREVIRATRGCKAKIALETTAGQGSSLGHRFEHLAELLNRVEEETRLAICVDTCHIFAAGYDIRTPDSYERTMSALEKIIGKRHIVAFHLNDSKGALGSRLDRHEHIGKGKIGLAGFRFLLNDPRWRRLPMVLETPKGEKMEEDVINLRRLRKLVR